MSESAKKKLKQTRLPFAIIASESGKEASPKTVDNSAGSLASRKRKPSNDGDNARSNKIGRVAKENIAEKDIVDIPDSDEEIVETPKINEQIKTADEVETTPTTAGPEQTLHIKLPSTTKSKRKINMDTKPTTLEDDSADDSIVYLDKEDVKAGKKARKSDKKSEKKKKKRAKSTSAVAARVKKTLSLETTIEEKAENPEPVTIADSEDSLPPHDESNKNVEIPIQLEKAQSDEVEPAKSSLVEAATDPEQLGLDKDGNIQTIPSNSSSPGAHLPEEIQDELIEMLSDDSDSSMKNLNSTGNREEGKTPKSDKFDITKLTPKQLARRQEQITRREQKELQRQKEREQKEQQRLKEKEQREEAKRKEKEEKEEARRKEKEDRERKKQAELDKKEEEKRSKEEERKRIADQKEEEKRLKEEERKRQVEQRDEEKRKREEAQKKKDEEEETRKKRAAEKFSKFFVVPKKKPEVVVFDDEISKDSAESAESVKPVKSNFMLFQIREGMKLAPLVRLLLTREQKDGLEGCLKSTKPLKDLYLNQLKKSSYKPGSSDKTWPKDDDEDEVVAIDELEGVGEDIQTDESKVKMRYRAKYLMFNENRRPAYYGTWRKKSKTITARRPFLQDQILDYEVDSDDEWEEEEPGESLHGSDSEKEKDADGEEYEVDNDFFVPHGHLSDEEMQQDQDEEDLTDSNHPEAQKAKLKILQQEFAAEMKKKTEKIKPRLIGCIWMNGDEDEFGCSKIGDLDKKYHCSDIIWRILKAREMMVADGGVKIEEELEPVIAEPETDVEKTPAQPKIQVRAKFTEESIKELIRLVHGNNNSKKFIIREFNAYRLKNYCQKDPDNFLEFSNKSVDEKMMEISTYKTCVEDGPMFGKKCWCVKPDIVQEFFGDEKLKLPNEWNYILEKEVKEKKTKQPSTSEGAKKEDSRDKSPVEAVKPKVTAEKKPKEAEKPKPPTPAPKKRVQLLMSVPCGQEISQVKKNNLISQYLKGNKSQPKPAETSSEVIEIDD